MDSERHSPNLIASTGDLYCCNIAETASREARLKSQPVSSTKDVDKAEGRDQGSQSNYFKSAQWSPDGTCLLTSSADNTFRTFVLPTDLLSSSSQPHTLHPYYQQRFSESISTLTPYPNFTLSNPETCLALTSYRDHPITLHSALYPTPNSKPIASYPLINPTTEAYLTPSSLIFSDDGSSFITGTDCLISLFDLSRNGQGPTLTLPTIPSKRHKLKGGGVGMRGIVSALALQNSSLSQSGTSSRTDILAAGTWNRWIGLYDSAGTGDTIANFSVANQVRDEKNSGGSTEMPDIGGQGISQVLWSPCGRYLLVVERKSSGVLIYDIRVTGRLLGWLAGREAETNQRLGVDVCVGDHGEEGGFEVWAGGTDGVVKVWEGVGKIEGRQDVSWELEAGGDPITSTIVHPSRTIVATSSGQRTRVHNEDASTSDSDNDDDDSESDSENEPKQICKPIDNSLKIWQL